MTERKNKRTKEFFREWLEKLQQESWQLELLISGLALFGIWESKDMLDGLSDYIELNATGALVNQLRNFNAFIHITWTIFFLNLLIHIIVRGLWIGAIGLRYVSGDIDYEALGYTERFENFLKKNVGDFDDYIERLEKLSSIIFSFTFLLLFFFVSILSLFVFMGLVAQTLNNFGVDSEAVVITFFLSMLILCLMVFIDFISFGSFKRVDSAFFTKVYYWIYRLMGILTLSFLFRPLFYNFIDDRYTRRLVIFAIPYILFISIVVPTLGFNADAYMPSFNRNVKYDSLISSRSIKYIHYDNLREQYARREYEGRRNPIIDVVSLDSYEYNEESLAKIFFRSSDNEGRTIENKFPDLDPFSEKGFHSLFNSSSRDNESLEAISTEEVEEKRFMRRILRGEYEKVSEDLKTKFESKLAHYQSFDVSSLDSLVKDIGKKYELKRRDYYEEYLDEMLAAKLSLIELQIDSTDITDQLDCSYFIHPNMGEKGILCYFPISSYSNGKHNITYNFERRTNSDDKEDIDNFTISFPFVINRKINF